MVTTLNLVGAAILILDIFAIVSVTGERRAVVLDNVPFHYEEEKAITRLLGTLQVDVRSAGGKPDRVA